MPRAQPTRQAGGETIAGGHDTDTSSGISPASTDEAISGSMGASNIPITIEMISAGLRAYREFLGDDRPIILDEKDLIIEIYSAMEQARKMKENL
jgi:hypothetical protein